MNDQITVVTQPDDIPHVDAPRILCVDLGPEQAKVISDSLLNIKLDNLVVLYMWKEGDSIDWVLDKKIKSDLIFFNAESFLKDVVGYFSAQRKSHYFGKLLNFNLANPREVYAVEDCQSILENFLRDYE